jgi:hypothetical protein
MLKNIERISLINIKSLLNKLYLMDSIYEIKEGVRYYKNTNKLVSESTSVVVIDSNNNKTIYTSLTDCAKNLHIGRAKIKHCLTTGESCNGYYFVLS